MKRMLIAAISCLAMLQMVSACGTTQNVSSLNHQQKSTSQTQTQEADDQHSGTQPSLNVNASSDGHRFVGSRDSSTESVDMPLYQDLSELMKETDLLIEGKVLDAKDVTSAHEGSTIHTALFTVEVSNILHGTFNQSTILVRQMGPLASDDMETKLRIGETYVLALSPQDVHGTINYFPVGLEQGIYLIKEDGSLYAYHDSPVALQIDGMQSKDAIQAMLDAAD